MVPLGMMKLLSTISLCLLMAAISGEHVFASNSGFFSCNQTFAPKDLATASETFPKTFKFPYSGWKSGTANDFFIISGYQPNSWLHGSFNRWGSQTCNQHAWYSEKRTEILIMLLNWRCLVSPQPSPTFFHALPMKVGSPRFRTSNVGPLVASKVGYLHFVIASCKQCCNEAVPK